MNKLINLIVVLAGATIFPYVLVGQNHDNVWLMSSRNGAAEINFSTGVPQITSIDLPIVMHRASATISNAQGELAFYTNGCQVYSADNSLMENGSGLNSGEIYNSYCDDEDWGYPAGPHAAVIIPRPYHLGEYYLLHQPLEYEYNSNGQPIDIGNSGMYCSKVNMNENNGYGLVEEKNILVDNSAFESGSLTLTKHANGEDWWCVLPLRDNNNHAIFLIDSSGVLNYGYHSNGLVDNNATDGGGQSRFSPSGDSYFRFNSLQGLQYWDFDRASGELSNYRHIPFPDEYILYDLGMGGVAVSPNGRYVYISDFYKIFQYDLESEDVANSMLLIGEVLNSDSLIIPPSAASLQLGPDCKIYAFSNSGTDHHVIHNPDESGLACNFEQSYLQMPNWFFRDHPYYPNYRLGPTDNPGSPCAEPLVGLEEVAEENELKAEVWPNPVMDLLTVAGPSTITSIELFDNLGRSVTRRENANEHSNRMDLNVDQFETGMYTLRISYGNQQSEVRKIVIH